MDRSFVKRYFQIDRSRIGYLRFLLEAYDGLAFARTLDPRRALVEIAYPPSRSVEAESLLAALVAELGLKEAATPEPDGIPRL